MSDLSNLTSRRHGASPAMVLALMGAVAGGGTVIVKQHDSNLTTEQAHALSDARTRSEAIQQHCTERYQDLMQRLMEKGK